LTFKVETSRFTTFMEEKKALEIRSCEAVFASGSDRTCLGVLGSGMLFPTLLSLLLCTELTVAIILIHNTL